VKGFGGPGIKGIRRVRVSGDLSVKGPFEGWGVSDKGEVKSGMGGVMGRGVKGWQGGARCMGQGDQEDWGGGQGECGL